MATVCPQCSRANPAEAQYCYFDGVSLVGSAAGPVDPARQAFAMAFVFPSGRACRNFDEFALACEQHWPEAVELLQKGHLNTFLVSQGRMDLAKVAEEAAGFPDGDRGLDQLLARLPAKTLTAPKLQVRSSQLHLGTLLVGQDHRFEIELENAGDRLLFGSVSSTCQWLAPADHPAEEARLLQFKQTLAVPISVHGQHLRASLKPLEGQLVIETNGGTVIVTVLIEVPIRPFAEGALAGARTPREVAEKAKKSPKEAARLFENGAVASWYQSNGWPYPVRGATAKGLGAVQQFFETLGLVKAPKVHVSEPRLQLRGPAGAQLRHQVVVRTAENRNVYANGGSSEPWLVVGPAKLKGAEATLPLEVNVPYRPGETVQATLHIVANGNQRFAVPVSVTVEGHAALPPSLPPGLPPLPSAIPPPMAIPMEQEPAPVALLATAAPSFWPHLIPVVLLALPLLGLVIADFVRDLPKP